MTVQSVFSSKKGTATFYNRVPKRKAFDIPLKDAMKVVKFLANLGISTQITGEKKR